MLIKLQALSLILLQLAPSAEPGAIFINGRQLSRVQETKLRQQYGVVPPPGRYWYDPEGGLWGLEGGGPIGFILPGHDLGHLSSDASAGKTGVFLNGREINAAEASYYRKLFRVAWHGRLWLDGKTGYVGMEGARMPLANLMEALRARAIESGSNGCMGFGTTESGVYAGCNKRTHSVRQEK